MGRPRSLKRDNVADAEQKMAKKSRRKRGKARGGSLSSMLTFLRDKDLLSPEDADYIQRAAEEAPTTEDLHALVRLQVALPLALMRSDMLSPKDTVVALNKASTQLHNLLGHVTATAHIDEINVYDEIPDHLARWYEKGGDKLSIN